MPLYFLKSPTLTATALVRPVVSSRAGSPLWAPGENGEVSASGLHRMDEPNLQSLTMPPGGGAQRRGFELPGNPKTFICSTDTRVLECPLPSRRCGQLGVQQRLRQTEGHSADLTGASGFSGPTFHTISGRIFRGPSSRPWLVAMCWAQ